MNAQVLALLDRAGYHVLWTLAAVLWQSSILVIAALGLSWLLRRRRASLRHFILTLAVLIVPVLPVLAWLAALLGTPRMSIPIIPDYRASLALRVSATVPDEQAVPAPRSGSEDNRDRQAAGGRAVSPTGSRELPVTPTESPGARATGIEPPAGERSSAARYPWALAFAAYLAGSLVFIVPITVFRGRLIRLLMSGTVIMEPRVLGAFRNARDFFGIGRDFVLVECESIDVPLTVGTFHPIVLLPPNFIDQISPEELDAVALHEMSHIRRNDTFVFTIVHYLRALLFFHPLIWIAARQITSLAEEACDDAVLDATGTPLNYAKMLMRIAEQLPGVSLRTGLTAGMLFSKRAFLRRVESILSDRRGKLEKLTRGIRAGMLSAAVLSLFAAVALPLAEKSDLPTDFTTIAGRVMRDGAAVKGAKVYLQVFDTHAGFFHHIETSAKTKKDGSFTLKVPAAKVGASGSQARPVLVACSPLGSPAWQKLTADSSLDNITLHLGTRDVLSGTVTDRAGNPVKGASLYVCGLCPRTDSDYANSLSNRNGGIPELSAVTGDNGEFAVPDLPENSRLYFKISAPGYATKYTGVVFSGSNGNVFSLEPEGRIAGRVTFGSTGKPARNIRLYVRGRGVLDTTETGRNGEYVMTNLAPGLYSIAVFFEEEWHEWTTVPLEDIKVEEGKTTDNADIYLVEGGIISGRIADADTDLPLARHTVTVVATESLNPLSLDTATTDMNGRYRLRVPPGKVEVKTRPPAGYVIDSNLRYSSTQLVEVSAGGVVPGVDFRFNKGLEIVVSALGPDGAPIGDARVTKMSEYTRPSETKTTDRAGTCTFTGLREGLTLSFSAEHRGVQLRGEGSIDVVPGAELVLRLEPYETAGVEGRVRDENGCPLAGVVFSLVAWKGHTGSPVTAAVTDSTGYYLVDDLIIGKRYSLRARAGGYAETAVPLESLLPATGSSSGKPASRSKARTVTHDIVMEKADRWIEATITDDGGTPVQGAQVQINGAPSGLKTAFSDRQGYVRLDDLVPVIEQALSIRHTDYGRYYFRFVPTNETHHFTLIKKQHTLEGIVVDGGNHPIEGASVTIDPHHHDAGIDYMRSATDAHGKFRIEHVIDEEVVVLVGLPKEGSGWKRFSPVTTNAGTVTLVFDAPDEMPSSLASRDTREALHLENRPSPELHVGQWVHGEAVRLQDLRGKIIILDFCISTPRRIRDYWRIMKVVVKEYGDDGVVVLGIHEYTGDGDAVRKFIADEGIPYRVAIDKKSDVTGSRGKTFDAYGIFRLQNLAGYTIIDREGKVHQDIGVFDLEKKIEELVQHGV